MCVGSSSRAEASTHNRTLPDMTAFTKPCRPQLRYATQRWCLLFLLVSGSAATQHLQQHSTPSAAAASTQARLTTANPKHGNSASKARILQAAAARPRQDVQQPSLPEFLLARGYKGLAPAVMRNWRRLADKLNTPGSNVTIVTFGGSITVGYIDDSPGSSWVDTVKAWFQGTYAAVNFTVVNLARSGIDVMPAATCWYQLAPQDADLVMIEYSVNGCSNNHICHSFASPRTASYELLVHRMMLRAPGAAFLSVAAFNFFTTSVPRQAMNPEDPGYPGEMVTLPNSYYGSGENFHTRIAHRYGVPVVSIRDALYDVIFDDALLLAATGMRRDDLLSPAAVVHPTTAGHVLYAKIIVYTVRTALANVLGTTPGTPIRRRQQQQQPLPPPISPLAAAEADGNPFCAESSALQQYATNSNGWNWTNPDILPCPHPNCNTYAFSSSGAGQTLQLTVDTQSAATSTNGAALDRMRLTAIYINSKMVKWAGKVGVAVMTCVSGCSCQPVMLSRPVPAANGGQLALAGTEVTLHPQCVVAVTILGSAPNQTGQDFYLTGIAVVPFTKQKPLAVIEKSSINMYMRTFPGALQPRSVPW
uniref:SGNH hydrolase-type esterase domain-containing protein n=1 Tax=Tetradesmus obliquus TaxID=3088 RepID=A0A383WF64_TETOB|eukprot:jgi/Sobl393_1/19339/SZX76061.1